MAEYIQAHLQSYKVIHLSLYNELLINLSHYMHYPGGVLGGLDDISVFKILFGLAFGTGAM